MARRYSIYYLFDRTNPSEKYIGQGSRDNYIQRPLEHFSGLYHYKDGGRYVSSRGNKAAEGPAFINWLHHTCLKDVECLLWDWSNHFGISDNDWVYFARQWAPAEIYEEVLAKSMKIAQSGEALSTFEDVKKLWGQGKYIADAAEIMHIYKASASGNTLLQVQMGGQAEIWRNLNNNSVLNRDMSPEQMANIINGAHMAGIQSVQDAFNQALQKQIDKSDDFTRELQTALQEESNMWTATKNAIENWLKEVNQKQTILQTIIRDVQNECNAHLVDFGLQFPKGHADSDAIEITFNTTEVQTLEKAIVNAILRDKEHLEELLSKDTSPKTIKDWLNKNVVGKISIGTFIKVNLKILNQSAISLDLSSGTSYIDEMIPHLKRMSYWYYMHFANEYFTDCGYGESSSNYNIDDQGFGNFTRVYGRPSCTQYVWNKYRNEGIVNEYTRSFAAWQEFNRGMLTCYTKNNGNAWFDGKLTPSIIYKNIGEEMSNPILMGYFDTELDDEKGFPFYKFSQKTWDYINSSFNINVIDLKEY